MYLEWLLTTFRTLNKLPAPKRKVNFDSFSYVVYYKSVNFNVDLIFFLVACWRSKKGQRRGKDKGNPGRQTGRRGSKEGDQGSTDQWAESRGGFSESCQEDQGCPGQSDPPRWHRIQLRPWGEAGTELRVLSVGRMVLCSVVSWHREHVSCCIKFLQASMFTSF